MNFKETALNYVSNENYATFCSSEQKWIRKIYSLKEKYPNEVNIICTPEENNDMLYVNIPKAWFKITPPRTMNLTDEQRAAAAERMRKARNTKEDK